MPAEASTVGDDQSMEELRRELAEAREQQAATAGILAAISNSPADAHGVFAEIAASAARLCDAYDAGVLELAGDHLRVVAHHGPIPVLGPIGQYTLPLKRGVLTGRAVLDRQTLQVADLQAETVEYPEGSEFARRLGHRTILAVPLIRAGQAIGAIYICRTEVRPFTDRQIGLLKTFADQAVIAIENTRLFEAEQARTRELTEALEQQTATSEILSVISSSPSDLQPVLDAVARSSARVCGAQDATVHLREADRLRLAAHHGPVPVIDAGLDMPLSRGLVGGRAVLDREPVHVYDVSQAEDFPEGRKVARRIAIETMLAVPLLREDVGSAS